MGTNQKEQSQFDNFFSEFQYFLILDNPDSLQKYFSSEYRDANCIAPNLIQRNLNTELSNILKSIKPYLNQLVIKYYKITSWGTSFLQKNDCDKIITKFKEVKPTIINSSIFKVEIDNQLSLYFSKTDNSFLLFAAFQCPKPQK